MDKTTTHTSASFSVKNIESLESIILNCLESQKHVYNKSQESFKSLIAHKILKIVGKINGTDFESDSSSIGSDLKC